MRFKQNPVENDTDIVGGIQYKFNGIAWDKDETSQIALAEMPGYSTEEVLTTERWTNGKPIYRKIINTVFGAKDADKIVHVSQSDIEIIDMQGKAVYGPSQAYTYSGGISGSSGTNYYTLSHNDDGAITIKSYHTDWANQPLQITVEYTKTTDTSANPVARLKFNTNELQTFSGTTESPGYDLEETLTTERWIDGKPIYRKVFKFAGVDKTYKDLEHNIINIDNTLSCETKLIYNATNRFYETNTGDYYSVLYDDAELNTLRFHSMNKDTTNWTIIVFVKYTKTTDTAQSPVAKLDVTVSNLTTTATTITTAPGYSTNEVLTEKRWIDGKPIYRRVFSGDPQTAQHVKIGNIIGAVPVGNWTIASNGIYWNDGFGHTGTSISYSYNPSSGDINIRQGEWTDGTFSHTKFVFEYTKNSDSALSPVAKLKFDVSHIADTVADITMPSYSTDEVLTEQRWVDGKPIYRNTFEFNNIANDTTTDIGTGVLGFNLVGYQVIREGNNTLPFYLSISSDILKLTLNTGITDNSGIVVIEYTKTSDTVNSPIAQLQVAVNTLTAPVHPVKMLFSATTNKLTVDGQLSFDTVHVDTKDRVVGGNSIVIGNSANYRLSIDGIMDSIGVFRIAVNGVPQGYTYHNGDSRGPVGKSIIRVLSDGDEVTFTFEEVSSGGAMYIPADVSIEEI